MPAGTLTPTPSAVPTLQAVFILAALFVIWFEVRHKAQRSPSAFSASRLDKLDLIPLLLIALANCDIYPLLRTTFAMPGYLPGDANSHALVAMHLFDNGPFSQWSEQYVGGFPLAVHYPILGWLLVALPVKLGVEPTLALLVVGYAALLSVPPLFYIMARRNGAAWVSCLVPALALTWLSPQSPFVGNIETFALTGLLSQAVCTPLMVLWAFELLGRGSFRRAVLYGNLCVLAHPQLAVAAAIVMGIAVVTVGNRVYLRRYVLSQGSAAAVAALVYGPGIVAMAVPFGWPDLLRWMHLGFGPDKLSSWLLDGELLDKNRAPMLMALWSACLLLLGVRVRREPAARAAFFASLLGLALCTVGPGLDASGRLGKIIVSVFQPLRMMATLPFIFAATVLLAFELYRDAPNRWLNGAFARCGGRAERWWSDRARPARSITLLLCSIPIWLPMGVALRGSRKWTYSLWLMDFSRYPPEWPCGRDGPSRSEITALQNRIAQLQGGRLWIDKGLASKVGLCTMTTGFERHSSVPSSRTDAVGAHVGILHEANQWLQPNEPDLSLQLEALGIRYALLNGPLGGDAATGLQLLERFGPFHLYQRTGASDYFGLGCIEYSLRGPTPELKQELVRALHRTDGRSRYLHPQRLVAIEVSDRPLSTTAATDPCRSDIHARLAEHRRAVGSYAATVHTDGPVELVLRATAHPGWKFSANGRPLRPHLVAPGYYAVVLGPGDHAVEATFRGSPLVPVGVALAWLLPLASAGLNRRTNARHPAKRKPSGVQS